jgi:hypothetical protein
MEFANVSDVADELGRAITDPAEMRQVNRWIATVERIVKGRIPDLDTQAAAGLIDPETVKDVQVAAVARRARNPEGLRNRTRTVSIDDYSRTEQATIDSAVSSGELYLTDAEWERLAPADVGAFTFRLGGAS